jgi:hypothetical protein
MLQGRGEEAPSTAASPLVEASCNKCFTCNKRSET